MDPSSRRFALPVLALFCLIAIAPFSSARRALAKPRAADEAPRNAETAKAELRRLGVEFTEDWLIGSARDGDLRLVRLFLSAGMSPNVRTLEERRTPLLEAAKGSHLEVVKELLGAGARPDEGDRTGHTALAEAVEGRRVDVVRGLIAGGANPNRRGLYGQTLLMSAVSLGEPELVQALLEGRANPNQANDYGVTPLAVAAEAGRVDLARSLLQGGAWVNVKDVAKNGPIVVAVLRGHREMVGLLIEAGADVTGSRKLLLAIADREGHVEIRRMIERAAATGPRPKGRGEKGS